MKTSKDIDDLSDGFPRDNMTRQTKKTNTERTKGY